jgi:hypothetical protein
VDGRTFTAATLLVNGKTATLTPNTFGYLLTLPEDENWDARDTVFRLTASQPLPVSLTLEPVADCRMLNLSPFTQSGADTLIGVFKDRDRTLMRFDLSGIPAGSSLFSSTLTLRASSSYHANPSANPVQVFRATKPWTEFGAVWSKYDGVTSWTNPGGDAVGTTGAQLASPYAVNTSDPAANGAMSWDINALVQEWVSGVNPNQGLLLALGGTKDSDLHFWSRENANPALRPTLTVIYTPPPTPDPATEPTPTDGAAGIVLNPVLSWTAGSNAVSHAIYFGTDATAVANATPASPEYQGSQPTTTWLPAALAGGTTYHWRIDETGVATTTAGTVWSFTTAVTDPYLGWAQSENLTPGLNDAHDDDPDHDGLQNLIEFILGGDPLLTNDSDRLPKAAIEGTNLKFTFTRDDLSESGTSLIVQYGGDLAGWTDVPIGTTGGTIGGAAVSIFENDANPDHVNVLVPMNSQAALFVRLKASRP